MRRLSVRFRQAALTHSIPHFAASDNPPTLAGPQKRSTIPFRGGGGPAHQVSRKRHHPFGRQRVRGDFMGSSSSAAVPPGDGKPPPRRKKYVRAVGPRLRVLMFVILGLVALLSANGLYLSGVTLLEWVKGNSYQNYF